MKVSSNEFGTVLVENRTFSFSVLRNPERLILDAPQRKLPQ